MSVTLVLPYPVSANRYWKAITIPGRTMMAPTKEATAYKAEVKRIARLSGIAQPFDQRVALEIRLYPQRPQDWAKRARRDPVQWDNDVRCMDLGNCEKVLSDALQGIVFTDDRWVWEEWKKRMEPDGEARVIVTVTPLILEQPQGELLPPPTADEIEEAAVPF